MAWEWTGTAVTGLVGLAGIAGTLLGSRAQRKTQMDLASTQRAFQERDAMRSEKKAACVRFLAAVAELADLTPLAKYPGTTKDELSETWRVAGNALRQVNLSSSEARIVASNWVEEYIKTVTDQALLLLPAHKDFGEKLSDYISSKLILEQGIIVRAFKEDLALEPNPDSVAKYARSLRVPFEEKWTIEYGDLPERIRRDLNVGVSDQLSDDRGGRRRMPTDDGGPF